MSVEWDRVRHFERAEFIEDPERMEADVVYLLDEMREAASVPFIIHVAWEYSGHVDNSAHYDGLAVDFHMEGLSVLDQWLFAERYPWNGLGIYPYWHQPGLHVDMRRLGREHPHLGKRWWRDEDGTYKAISRDFLKLLTA